MPGTSRIQQQQQPHVFAAVEGADACLPAPGVPADPAVAGLAAAEGAAAAPHIRHNLVLQVKAPWELLQVRGWLAQVHTCQNLVLPPLGGSGAASDVPAPRLARPPVRLPACLPACPPAHPHHPPTHPRVSLDLLQLCGVVCSRKVDLGIQALAGQGSQVVGMRCIFLHSAAWAQCAGGFCFEGFELAAGWPARIWECCGRGGRGSRQ